MQNGNTFHREGAKSAKKKVNIMVENQKPLRPLRLGVQFSVPFVRVRQR
jgi:Holliday junction resolvase RusA-like endonuclease